MKYFVLVMLVFTGGAAYAQLDRPALDSFLHRIVGEKASGFIVEEIRPRGGKDVFELEGRGSKIVLRGSNGLSVASALNYYLKNYCRVLITWNGAPRPLPAALPRVTAKVRRETPYTYRYYLNYCTFQYSMAWWDWQRWQREIDWMALNGINMPLALTGEEAVWQEVYKGLGFSDSELDKFYTGPAFFSWLWMGNIDAWGGPLPAHWKESHAALQQKILKAQRSFGMKPVLPAFTGHVPPSFANRFPGAKVKKTNWDAGFEDVYILDASDTLFEVIGKRFIEAQTRLFGTDHFYSADTFNENVPPTSDSTYLDGMSKKVYASMAEADPKAVWVMQGWMFHYNAAYWKPTQIQALLKAVPDEGMIVLDLYSEAHPMWNTKEASGPATVASADGGLRRSPGNGSPVAYFGKPWIWNMLHNFGGNISLWGRMRSVAEDPSKALHDPAAGKMVGIGLTPEGIEQNPALYQLMLENVWQDGPVDLKRWLHDYAVSRYGVADPAIDSAWRLLERSVYNGGLTEGGMESILQARPTLEPAVERVNTKLSYDPAVLRQAWKIFVGAAPRLSASDGYRYDLVDITRQVMANYASVIQQQFVQAWKDKDQAAFRQESQTFLMLMDDMDRLLGTRKDFLLGKWIADARACGVTKAESDLYEQNARDLVTLWGDKESGLREYSCRQWNGLIKGFYKPRWELFFARMQAALGGGGEMDFKQFEKDVKDWEWTWVLRKDVYASTVKGDAVAEAVKIYNKWYAMMDGAKKDVLSYVDPFIGTARSDAYTRWGNEGGTYPGAVAPWGSIQLTPETRAAGGYDYRDSVIRFFSLMHHMSGYPNGSAGMGRVMPVRAGDETIGERATGAVADGQGGGQIGALSGRPFDHTDETASPGYYKIRLKDDGTIIEATAAAHAGIFRFRFPEAAGRRVFVGGIGKIDVSGDRDLRGAHGLVVKMGRGWKSVHKMGDGLLVQFDATVDTLEMWVSESGKGAGAGNLPGGFQSMLAAARESWRKGLEVVEIDDDQEEKKKIFYTALYHAMLLPWENGNGAYSGFSAWDTFRSLHPLLCLLFPDRQRAMIRSLLDIYRQRGHLPADPMTGNHAVAVIVDTWMKGIRGYDSAEVNAAIRKGVAEPPYIHADREAYTQKGYIPSGYPESVTRTVEYAYDDWAIRWFGARADDAGYNYRHLFDADRLFILPDGGERGNSGYKEGDKWVYSYFAAQHPDDLVRLMGGGKAFVRRLDSALRRQDILFDNETVFHIPYFFNYAGAPGKAQDWVAAIRERWSTTPGGIPGNDDLGSMSSWWIFSALGLYPFCPGRPVYDVCTPLFRKVRVRVGEGRMLELRARGLSRQNRFVRRLMVNGKLLRGWQIPHDVLVKGGILDFEMDSVGVDASKDIGGIELEQIRTDVKEVKPDQRFYAHYTVVNNGQLATKIVRVMDGSRIVGERHSLLKAGQRLKDSVACRLYAAGAHRLMVEGREMMIKVVAAPGAVAAVGEVRVTPMVKRGGMVTVSYLAQNIGGWAGPVGIPVVVDGKVVVVDSISLQPADTATRVQVLAAGRSGMHAVKVMDHEVKYKVYDSALQSAVLDLADAGDRSGFDQEVRVVGATGKALVDGKERYAAIGSSPSLDRMGNVITMMVHVFPVGNGESLMDIFSKGDNHVLQVSGNRELTFFAGGWGRGDCTVPLPVDWMGRWHCVVGVCEGSQLKLYIDGDLKGTAQVEGRVNLSVPDHWVLGRNEEFPGQRAFNGRIDAAKVYAEALTADEVRSICR